ncbi:hypothetical protein [Fulvivirga lutea]|uniref:tRNA (Guanine-N1)-methyltransferase n=1 Tax=Fulvivirga lutea TaxID=2810512 RepID=A0A974WF36_9BACT|nr:hypothetical protein [Fulvivirga lutea]QSE96293.1 hypothetical protein JR347_11810 [Fulvivirga lutea]
MKSLLFTIFILFASSAISQKLNDQFSVLMDETETFKEYKVIKIQELNSFWKGVTDSINNKHEIIVDLQAKNQDLNNQVTSLEVEIKEAQAQIESLQGQISTISIFGIAIDKTVYKVVNFTLLSTLILIIGLIFFRLKERVQVANAKIKDYNNLESKFEEYRRKSLENQMKLRRELQTERNKLEEIRSI